MRLLDRLSRPRSGNRLAFVFYATDEDYAVAVLVFVRILQELGIRKDADVVALHLPLNASIVEKMRRLGIRTRLVAPVPGVKVWHYRHCLVKLKVLTLTEYERVLFVDADAIPLRSLDDILSLPLSGPIAAPRAYWLKQPAWTSALLVLRPSMALWARVKRHFGMASRHNFFDMDIVKLEFGKEIESLPSTVFCLNTELEAASPSGLFADPVEAYSRISVVHFSAVGKPWTYPTAEVRGLKPNAHPLFYEIWDKWRRTRDEVLA
jgi:hypothetical protein